MPVTIVIMGIVDELVYFLQCIISYHAGIPEILDWVAEFQTVPRFEIGNGLLLVRYRNIQLIPSVYAL